MAHNGAPTNNPEEAAAAEAARLAAEQLREAVANKEIEMTIVKGAKGERDVLMPKDPDNQVKWVTSELNTGKLTETQRSNLKPEAQEAYSGWLAAREVKATREQAVTAQKAEMAEEARGQVDKLFNGGGTGDVPTRKTDQEHSAKPVEEQLDEAPVNRGFDEIDPATGRPYPKVEATGPVKRGLESLPVSLEDAVAAADERAKAKGNGNGHELVPVSEQKSPAKVVKPRRPSPSPRPRPESNPATPLSEILDPKGTDANKSEQGPVQATPRAPKPVTNVKPEPGDGKKAGEIIANALGGKSTEHAGSPADKRPTDVLATANPESTLQISGETIKHLDRQTPAPEAQAGARPTPDAETTQNVPKAEVEALDEQSKLSDTVRSIATRYADAQASLGTDHPRTKALGDRLDDQLGVEYGVMSDAARKQARDYAVKTAAAELTAQKPEVAQAEAAGEAPAPTQPEASKPKPGPRPRGENAKQGAEGTPGIARETMKKLDPNTTLQLGFRMAEAVSTKDSLALVDAGRDLDKYLKSVGVTDPEMLERAKRGIVDQGDMYLLAAQQADAIAAKDNGMAKAAGEALVRRLTAQGFPPEQSEEIAGRMLLESVHLRNDVRNEQFAQLTAAAMAAPEGSSEREAAKQRMHEFNLKYSDLSGPQSAVLVAETLQRAEAAQAAEPGKPARTAEPEWPTVDTDRIPQDQIDTLDAESKREALDAVVDQYVSVYEAAGGNEKDPQVIAMRRSVEHTLRKQYPNETDMYLTGRANDAVKRAYVRLEEAHNQADPERTGRTSQDVIDEADRAGNHQQTPKQEAQADRAQQWNRELARRIADIPTPRSNTAEYVEAQQDLRNYLAHENPDWTPKQVDQTAAAFEHMANQEADIAEAAFLNINRGPDQGIEYRRLVELVQNDPRFANAPAHEQQLEIQRLLHRARIRFERRNAEAAFDEDDQPGGSGPDDGAGGAGAKTRPNTNTGPTGNTETTERYENYDRLLASLQQFNNGEKLDKKTREQLLRDLYEYSQSEGQSQANRDFAAGKFEQVMESMSKRQQNAFRRELAEESRTEENDWRARNYIKSPIRTWKIRRGNAKARRATARGLRYVNAELGIDANGDTAEDLMSVPEGGFNEGDFPMIEMTKRGIVNRLIGRHPKPRGRTEVDEAYRQANRVLNDPNISPANKQAIFEYRNWLMSNYQNFDWNQLSGNQDAGFLPRFMRRPSRRNDEPGIVDELNNMVKDAATQAYGPPRQPRNNSGSRRPPSRRPGGRGARLRRRRQGKQSVAPQVQPPFPQRPPVPPVPPQPFPRPQGPPRPGPGPGPR